MAFANVFTAKRSDYGTLTNTPGTRGLVLNGYQIEEQVCSKLTGDAAGNITMTTVRRPYKVYAMVLKDNAGADQAALSMVELTFTNTSDTVIALSGLGNWTRALIRILGRNYA